MSEKELLAQALREFSTWGDAYIATLARAERAEQTNTRLQQRIDELEEREHDRRMDDMEASERE